jgi:hypothetical protein
LEFEVIALWLKDYRMMYIEKAEKRLAFATPSPTIYALLPTGGLTRRHVGESLMLPGYEIPDANPAELKDIFASLAQAAYLLDRVIEYIVLRNEDITTRQRDGLALDTAIRTFAMNLLHGRESDRLGHCWPYAICLRFVAELPYCLELTRILTKTVHYSCCTETH